MFTNTVLLVYHLKIKISSINYEQRTYIEPLSLTIGQIHSNIETNYKQWETLNSNCPCSTFVRW